MTSRPLLVIALTSVLGLGACATATPYQPFNLRGSQETGGYREIQLEPQRWRVTFSGNSLTSRETVETYLLYRAAELTVEQGSDWFAAVQRNTSEHTEVYVYRHPAASPWGPAWGPRWRYRRPWWIWQGWDPYGPEPFFDEQRVTAYEATAEIVMGRGAKPADDPKAFEARAVLASLKDKVITPGTGR